MSNETFPELLADRHPNLIVLNENRGVVVATVNSDFEHLRNRLVAAYNSHEDLYKALAALVNADIGQNARYDIKRAIDALKKVNPDYKL